MHSFMAKREESELENRYTSSPTECEQSIELNVSVRGENGTAKSLCIEFSPEIEGRLTQSRRGTSGDCAPIGCKDLCLALISSSQVLELRKPVPNKPRAFLEE